MNYRNRFKESEVISFWDKIAENYVKENEKVDKIHNQRFVETVKNLRLKPGMKVLNVWSRDGGLVPFIRKACEGIELTNYELSPKLCKLSKKLYPNEKFIQGSLHDFPFKDNHFDVIISLETLEHVSIPLKFLNECYRVIKYKGQFVMSLPPATAEYTSIAVNLLKLHHGEGPHRFLPPQIVKSMLATSGFKLIKHKGTLFFYIGPKFLEKYVPKFLKDIFGIRQFYISYAEKTYNPSTLGDLCLNCGTCFGAIKEVCPGRMVDFKILNSYLFGKQPKTPLGNYKSIYVGHSKNKEVWMGGASGGVVTQVLLDLLKAGKIDYAVTTGFKNDTPWIPEPKFVENYKDVIDTSQSKYTITPTNSLLAKIRNKKGNCAIVALPCQVHAIRMLQQKSPVFKRKIKYVIGLYCGNILNTGSTYSLMQRFKIKPGDVKRIAFREGDWPGNFVIETKKGRKYSINKFYWNYLIPFYIQPRCLMCIDLANEFADLSVGDGWLPRFKEKGNGWSIIVSRTDAGEEMLKLSNIYVEKITEKEAINMHSHGYDFKKIGAFIRIEKRMKKGLPVPEYNVDWPKISRTRRIREYFNISVFRFCKTNFARTIANLIPLSLMGKIVNIIRKTWRRKTQK